MPSTVIVVTVITITATLKKERTDRKTDMKAVKINQCYSILIVLLCMYVLCRSVVSDSLQPDLIDYRLPGSSVHEDSPGKNTGAGCHALLQGIFPTQGSNPDLPHCRRILNHLSYQESHIYMDIL